MRFTVLITVCLQRNVSFAFQPSSTSTSLRALPSKALTRFENVQKNGHFRARPDGKLESDTENQSNAAGDSTKSPLQQALEGFTIGLFRKDGFEKLPPLRFEDLNLLFYDVFLIVNLSLSISFWVTHRLNPSYLGIALNEGCIFSLCWMLSGMCFEFSHSFMKFHHSNKPANHGTGLYHGAFLLSSVNGNSEAGGPKEAFALGLNTQIGAINIRLLFALVSAALHHREVGMMPIEGLIPLEVGCGVVLMSMWRALHSYAAPRI